MEYAEDFGELVKEARIRMGWTQEDLARQLNEKLTIIKKIEAGEFHPPLDLARRIERVLKIRILVPPEEGLEELSRFIERGRRERGVSLESLLKKRKD